MSERLSMQGFIQYLSNGVAWALSNGLTADDLGDDVPESIKDAWDELRDQWDSLAHDADNFMDMLEGGRALNDEKPGYYKATRPDGTDFYTGTVDYAAALASGEPLPELPGDDVFPGEGWYHLATVPTECVGMSWPCRLFEVEPVDDLGEDRPRHEHKVGATSVRVLREIDAHQALGPQGEHVAALIERCRTLTGDELDNLVAAWAAAQDAAWVAARGAAWVAARDAARAAAWDAARAAAWDAAWAAAGALLCRDLIGQAPGWDQAAYNSLTGPWRDVIGPIHPDDGDSDE